MKYKKASCLSVAMAALLLVCFTNIFVAFACEAPLQTNYAEPYSTELLTTDGKVISRSINGSINSNYTDTRIDNTNFYGETVNCINGISGPHEESNAHMATYTNNGGTWSLKSGQTVMITLDVVPVENAEDGWSVYLGYQKMETILLYQIRVSLLDQQRCPLQFQRTENTIFHLKCISWKNQY